MALLASGATANGRRHSWIHGASEVRAGWRLLIFVSMVVALYAAKAALLQALLHSQDEIVRYLGNKLLQFLVFLLATWCMARLEGRRIADYGLPWRRMLRGRFWQGIAGGFLLLTALLVGLRLAGVFSFGSVALHGAEVWAYAGLYAAAFFLIGLEEEFRYRGYALRTLASGIGFWPAAIVLAALFGWSHLGNRGETWTGAFNAGVGALFLCLLLRRTGDLWMAIGFHAAWDWAESFFYGVPDSGATVPGHLLESSFSGPAWLTGGSVGPEGSWLCTLVFGLAAVAAAAWLRGGPSEPPREAA
jgi:membrane protease YdiL (CAAX protease family)